MKLVDVPKDLREIEDKVFKNLTKRQVIHLIIATPLLFAIYTTTNIIVDDIFTSSLVSFICVFPLFLNLFYKKEGLTFLEILKLKHFKDTKNRRVRVLNYENFYNLIKRIEVEEGDKNV